MGIGAQLGVKQETTYGTAVTVDKFFPFSGEELEPEHKRIDGANQRAGQLVLGKSQTEPYLIGAAGTITMDVITKDFGWWLKWAMGSLSSGSVSDSTYPHTCTLAATRPSFTAQVNREQADGTDRVFTYEGCKIAKWSLEQPKEGVLMFSADVVAENYATATSLEVASYTSGAEVFPSSLAYATVGGTATPVESWKVEVDNNLKTDRIFQRTSASGGPQRMEPLVQGRASITWNATVNFDSLTNFNRFAATTNAAMHTTLVFTSQGPTLLGASTYPSVVTTIDSARVDSAKGSQARGAEASFTLELAGVGTDDASDAPLTVLYSNSQSAFS